MQVVSQVGVGPKVVKLLGVQFYEFVDPAVNPDNKVASVQINGFSETTYIYVPEHLHV